MGKLLIYRLSFVLILSIVKPMAGLARETGESTNPGFLVMPSHYPAVADTVRPAEKPVEKPAEKAGEKATDKPQEVKPTDIIKEVPKSRRMAKPIAVPAPIRLKPIKIIKPNVIKPKVRIGL